MDVLTGNINKLYLKYLLASIGSAIIVSIYSTVDIIVSGQYEGPVGSAALSVIMPMWSAMLSLGILLGIGGSILMSQMRGAGNKREGDEYFTISLITAAFLSLFLTLFFIFFRKEFLYMCGADEVVLPYAMAYSKWLVLAVPFFLIGEVLITFVRNDGAPAVAMLAIVCGGVFNMFGDVFFVFTCEMGIEGAGLATAMGQVIGVIVICTYFFRKRCKLKLVKLNGAFKKLLTIVKNGFAPFIIDISFGVTVILFNNQIMRYSGQNELAVFGSIANLAILIQSIFYGVGQALQPIVSANAGAKNEARVKKTLGLSMITAVIMGVFFTGLLIAFATPILKAYMDVTPAVLAIGPTIVRKYSVAFLLMGINVVASYYFQALMRSRKSLIISLLRGFILCAALVYILPLAFGFPAIWWTMPLTEVLTSVVAFAFLKHESAKEAVEQ